MLKSALIAVIGIAAGFAGGQLLPNNQSVSELNLTADPEMLFAVRYQSAEYTLAALEKIKQNEMEAASRILEASLMLDEAEMAVCANNPDLCSANSQKAFNQFKKRKGVYLEN